MIIPEIRNDGNYLVIDFEGYTNISENYFLTRSYFYRENINENLCQWHVAEMSEDGTIFSIIHRLGSSHIYREDVEFDSWLQRAKDFLADDTANTANTAV